MSRYSHPCPACGAIIRPSDIHGYSDSFPCPACGEWLKYNYKHTLSLWVVSILGAIILTWHLGYRGSMLIIIATCAALLLCALGFFFVEMLDPSGFKRIKVKPSDGFDRAVSLHLTNKSDTEKKISP